MKKQKLFIILFWILSIILTSIWSYENNDKLEIIKSYFLKKKAPKIEANTKDIFVKVANSFSVKISKVITLSEKTAFVIFDKNVPDFDESSIKIYTQNGYLINQFQAEKLNLPNSFTLKRNGGVKTVFFHNNKAYALVSSSKKDCLYASIVALEFGKEVYKSRCIPGIQEIIDFNGLGSANIHLKNKIYLSLGTPEQHSTEISYLAQDENSIFGKIVEIDKSDLDDINSNKEDKLKLKIFTKGHRTPQGLTRINDVIFNVEHGPRGGDELNKIIEGKNYGWPLVSYGTRYNYDNDAKSFLINHEKSNFEEPLYAFVPSVGISSLNVCPKVLLNYYKKPCLIGLTLSGNQAVPGHSILIFLLDKNFNKVHSIEKIYIRDGHRLRHFVTNSKNELYEDKNGHIYISMDKKGIYRINFFDFR